ncbi:rho/rac/cdc gtpase-activating protein [Anaeramoeba ignava]|uniref:Rho/rac/cdc gtpase-activating protein n=1 Tax=Anaeramoeba ignava TaxID=1746090 RepID=A0A9Q0R5E2_ANAIG|nr:rho/rac/cdc gtpase-activating protein [Anaeramoeba ignava]
MDSQEKKMAATLLLHIVYPFHQSTQTMDSSPVALVREIKERIFKINGLDMNRFEDYGLYCTSDNGFWLEEDRTLMSYELWKQESIEFRQRIALFINVKYQKQDKNIEILEGVSLAQQLPKITREFGEENFYDFSLFHGNHPLDRNKSITNQNIDDIQNASFTLVRKVKFRQDQNQIKKEEDSTPIFTYPLSYALNRGGRQHEVPRILVKCFDFIEKNGINVEGIYRKMGTSENVAKLKEFFDQTDDLEIESVTKSPHDTAEIVKLYLRELGEPLIPNSLYDDFIKADGFSILWEKMEFLNSLVDSLPKPNFESLKLLCQHMNKVSGASSHNKMTLSNLAMFIGPLILRKKVEETQQQYSICLILFQEFEFLFLKKPKNYIPDIYAKANFAFKAEREDELEFDEGDILEIISKKIGEEDEKEGGWWFAKSVVSGKEGLIPSSYVEMTRDYVPPRKGSSSQKHKGIKAEILSLEKNFEI